MKVPTTYAEWVTCIDALMPADKDEEVLLCMQAGIISWSTGVAERFSKLLLNTVNYRMNLAADKFDRAVKMAGNNENAIIGALLAVRREYLFLLRLVSIKAIPEAYRKQYMQQVLEQVNRVQESLEASARTDRTGRLFSVVRNNRVNNMR